ncbi:hypothetical protein PSPO01_12590 [Paraphaeosphaeria sporulosa]
MRCLRSCALLSEICSSRRHYRPTSVAPSLVERTTGCPGRRQPPPRERPARSSSHLLSARHLPAAAPVPPTLTCPTLHQHSYCTADCLTLPAPLYSSDHSCARQHLTSAPHEYSRDERVGSPLTVLRSPSGTFATTALSSRLCVPVICMATLDPRAVRKDGSSQEPLGDPQSAEARSRCFVHPPLPHAPLSLPTSMSMVLN